MNYQGCFDFLHAEVSLLNKQIERHGSSCNLVLLLSVLTQKVTKEVKAVEF